MMGRGLVGGVFNQIENREPVHFEKWESEGTKALRVHHDKTKQAVLDRDGDDFRDRIAHGETITGVSESANAEINQADRVLRRELADFVGSKMATIVSEHKRLLTEAMVAAPAINRLRVFEHNMTAFLRNAGQPIRRTAVIAEGPLLAHIADFHCRAERILADLVG